MIEKVIIENKVHAIIIRSDHYEPEGGVRFVTEDNYSQQMAYMHHEKGKIIDAHIHNHEHRDVVDMQEVLVIRKGKLRVDFYSNDRQYFGSKEVNSGDIILLVYGGHGFEVLEEIEMVEIKQGPYLGDRDKVRFQGVDSACVKWI